MSVFISYGKEDRADALILYELLMRKGLSPWIDIKNLLPGQRWELEIDKAIRKCDIFLACLSKKSVSKRGFVQSELQRALKVLDMMPEDRVFLIPVRLNDCTIPHRLAHLQWIDNFAPDGKEKLIEIIGHYLATLPQSTNEPCAIPQLSGGLSIQTQQTEYVTFVVFNPKGVGLPSQVPPHSFINSQGGLVAHSVPLSTIGLNQADYAKVFPPHIPEGEVTIDFTVVNDGKTAIVNGVFVEVAERLDLPDRSLLNTFLPVLEPIEDTAILSSGQSLCRLFRGKVFSYKDGDVDLFRVNVLISDREEPAVFRFRFRIDYMVGGTTRQTFSEYFYLAKYRSGRTSRIPYSKSRRFQGEASTSTERAIPDSQAQNETESFLNEPEDGTLDSQPTTLVDDGLALVAYVKEHFFEAVMAGERDELQRNGFAKVEQEQNPFSELLTKMGGLNTSWVCFKPSGSRGYSSTVYDDVEIYTGNTSKGYNALANACKELARKGEDRQQENIIQFMVEAIRAGKLDVAAVIDSVSLLAGFRRESAYKGLVLLLNCGHTLVEKAVTDVFERVVYPDACLHLMHLLERRPSYSTLGAMRALGPNGNTESAKMILKLYDDGYFPATEVGTIAQVLLHSAPALSRQIVHEYLRSGSIDRRQLAYKILGASPPMQH